MNVVQRVQQTVEKYQDTKHYIFVDERKGELIEDRLAFTELDNAARSIGTWLTAERMRDEAALVLYPAGLEFLRAFFGCLYSRVVAVPSPLPQTDPRALERAEGIIKDADIRMVLTDSANLPMLTEWLHEAGLDGQVRCVATDALALPDPQEWVSPELTEDTIAYMQYTSGSTSEPRGVMLSHANLLHNCEAMHQLLGLPETGVGAGWLPHYHDMGLIGMLIMPIWGGGSLAFTSPVSFVMRPALWLKMISRYKAEYTVAPNFAYDWLLRGVTDAQLEGLDLSSLKFALNGAEPIRTTTLKKIEQRFGPIGFDPSVWAPGYGMAEATLLITGTPCGSGATVATFDPNELELHRAVPADEGAELVGCGRPINMSVHIVDPVLTEPLPAGRVGEIWVQGDSVAQGYWQRTEESASTFGATLADGSGPYLRTGDLGFLLDGELFVTGRLKDVIIVNGRNLYPQDIEEAGRDAHPALGAAAAFGVTADREHIVLVQEVRPKDLGGLTIENLAKQVKRDLTRVFAVPAVSVVLVRRNSVGKTTSGKIQRRRTRELFLDGQLNVLHAELDPPVRALVRADSAPQRKE
jgi:acyl-CoA synthetase (AMP-forming)/AMP-acid ligase II